MFDFLRRNQPPSSKQIDKVVKRLTETGGEDGPRIEAAEKLSEWGTSDALYGLLKRFTISSKVITQDIEEKRMIVRMLVEKGTDAVEPIQRFIHHAPSCRMARPGVVGNSSANRNSFLNSSAFWRRSPPQARLRRRTQSGFDSRHAWPRDARDRKRAPTIFIRRRR